MMKKIFFYTLLVIILALNFLYAIFILKGKHGWDAEIYCSAVQMEQRGSNPYIGNQAGEQLTWNYLPIYLGLFSALCLPSLHFTTFYPIFYTMGLLVCILLWLPGRDWSLAFTLASCSFLGFLWNLKTGNIGVIELFFLSLAFFFLARKKWKLGAGMLGLMAGFKLLPIVYLPLIFFAPAPKRARRIAFGIGLVGFLLPLALSYLLFPTLAPWFLRQLLGLIPGQHSPILESGDSNNPALPYLVAGLFSSNDHFVFILLVTTLLAAVFVAIGIVLWRKVIVHLDPSRRFEFIFSLSFLAVTLLLPRMKPYTFILAAPALFWLSRMEDEVQRSLILALSALLPLVVLMASPWLPDLLVLDLIVSYSQILCLLATVLALIVFRWKAFR
jgi:hypothetical protein